MSTWIDDGEKVSWLTVSPVRQLLINWVSALPVYIESSEELKNEQRRKDSMGQSLH